MTSWRSGLRLLLSADVRVLLTLSSHLKGLTIGSEMSGGISDVRFTNIRIYNSGPSVRIKSQCGRSGYIRDVLYENITGDNVVSVFQRSMGVTWCKEARVRGCSLPTSSI